MRRLALSPVVCPGVLATVDELPEVVAACQHRPLRAQQMGQTRLVDDVVGLIAPVSVQILLPGLLAVPVALPSDVAEAPPGLISEGPRRWCWQRVALRHTSQHID